MNQSDAPGDEIRLCWRCVSDNFLNQEIRVKGKRFPCSFCGSRVKTFPLGKIADRIEQAFENHFERTSPDPTEENYSVIRHADDYFWEREGEPVAALISEVAGVEEEIAEAIVEILCDRHWNFELATMSEETEFATDSYYRPRPESGFSPYHQAWTTFEKQLQTECRYFSADAQAVLNKVFDGVEEFETRSGELVVRTVGPDTDLTTLFRARVFQSTGNLEAALKRPDLEISPPPSDKAAAGRMNAQGISVFYGANDPETALAEVRPPVGSKVVIGEFELLRPLRILDIRALREILVRKSYFDPNSRPLLERAAFLGELSQRIIQPAMPEREHRDYLVTQVIADYLASECGLDGILFPSVQTNGGFNLVLFHRAARTEKLEIPAGTDISVGPDGWDDDGPSPDYSVVVTITTPEGQEKNDQEDADDDMTDALPFSLDPLFDVDGDYRLPTLRLKSSSLIVRSVTGVQYASTSFGVRRTVVRGCLDLSWME